MRGLKFYDKVLFSVNSMAAVMLLLSYLLPHVEPKKFAFISILSLGVPFLIIVNIIFFIYWLLKVRRQMLLSILVLLLGYQHVFSLYKFSSSKAIENTSNFTVMNYNVRLFNVFNWIENKRLKQDLRDFIVEQKPDIINMQEYRPDDVVLLKGYHKYVDITGDKVKTGQAIFSRFPIINSGSIEFPNTSNNAIFADIKKDQDTIRIYNVHLQSMGIDPTVEHIANENSKNLVKRVSHTFETQQQQTEMFLEHKKNCPYKMIVSGDFNNTAYSYVYKNIKGDLQDSFVEAGNGFGRTLNFDFFPVRIDFIFAENSFQINGFKNFEVNYSDHFPIIATLNLDSD
ncbi:Metal-dependent hydrolase, endonuclease/exonuclease/phosphatase family [Flavobacteriaceae bacterium MAR_2010_188]|nr:Metal-dependent hydrolase, endonuclease/exonuclease/phosphatase family [Flavobacteriaceae bacterium MAR_2010_188]